jgi:RimJ/RimL family protein N-acetyltransferase
MASPPTPNRYPEELEREVTLADGTLLRIRPVVPEDETRLMTFHGRLSLHTAYQRFFTHLKRLPPDWAHFFANVDYCQRMALVAERSWDWRPELVGVARYEPPDEEGIAEMAIVLQDYWQGRGLGAMLLEDLLRAGEACGIHRFRALVLADNDRMLALLSRVANIQQRTTDQGVVNVVFTPPRTPVTSSGESPRSGA